jgi:hypothetical protein
MPVYRVGEATPVGGGQVKYQARQYESVDLGSPFVVLAEFGSPDAAVKYFADHNLETASPVGPHFGVL